ncbi:hypothetical protein HSR121_0272 [Halapricum desulfuricans]|uniref:Uncharacterized protein n=1 Tax=Halapricum desulfuricans TaxID=2841257 RepID=A0A897MXB8_9EURY|nr:hypothetical protein HSR121_0272 [Halapricum desulfuricans]
MLHPMKALESCRCCGEKLATDGRSVTNVGPALISTVLTGPDEWIA